MTGETSGRALGAGERVGRYRIERVLGVGGFGITYLAEDEQLKRKVAVKEYFPELAHREAGSRRVQASGSELAKDYAAGLERFAKEARVLGGFNHPNIVRVHDVVEAHGTAYMVMEYVEGETLEERLSRGKLEDTEELWLILFRRWTG